jgi:hypothetical protein
MTPPPFKTTVYGKTKPTERVVELSYVPFGGLSGATEWPRVGLTENERIVNVERVGPLGNVRVWVERELTDTEVP